MEIDITEFFNNEDPYNYSASAFEMGDDVGRITWNNALNCPILLLDTEEKQEAFKEWVSGFGAWEDEEIQGWNEKETNALFIQFVSGEMREHDMDDYLPADFDWQEYEAKENTGNIFKGIDDKIYFGLY